MQKTLLSLLVGVILGGGGVLMAQQRGIQFDLGTAGLHAPAAAPQKLALGQSVAGEINKHSDMNYANGSRSQRYTFPVVQGTRYKVLVDGPLNASLSVLRNDFLLRSAGQGQRQNNYCGSPHVQPRERPFYFMADETGDVVLAVSGVNAYSYGPYNLTVTPEEGKQSDASVLVVDRPIENTAAGSVERYTFSVEDEGLYVFDLESCSFDSLLSLSGKGVNASDDDGGDGYNARITQWLTPGEYTLDADTAGSTEDEMFGPYVIKVGKQAIPANAPLAQSGDVLEAGKTVTVIPSDAQGSNPVFSFTLKTRSTVTLTARSTSIDTVLELQGENQTWEDDDSGGGTDARIREVLPAGDYQVIVRSYGRGAGMATLSFEAQPSHAPASGASSGERPRPKRDAGSEAVEAASEAAAAGAAAAAEAAAIADAAAAKAK